MASSAEKHRARRARLAAGASVGGGTSLVASGFIAAMFGVSVLHYDQYLRYSEVFVFKTDDTFWGWVFVAAGILLAVAGFAAMTGTRWGHTAGNASGLSVGVLMLILIAWYPSWVLPVILLIALGLLMIAIANRTPPSAAEL